MTTIFEQEISSQADILRRRAEAGMEQSLHAASKWRRITHAVVAGRGSSDNAAIFFQYLAGQELGLLVALAATSLYEGEEPIGLDGAGVLVISQSGRSPGMAEVLSQARAQHRPAIVITNDVTSPLAVASENVIDLGAGPERAIASSKTFSTTWHALAQFVAALKGEPLEGLATLPDMVERVADLGALGATAFVDPQRHRRSDRRGPRRGLRRRLGDRPQDQGGHGHPVRGVRRGGLPARPERCRRRAERRSCSW